MGDLNDLFGIVQKYSTDRGRYIITIVPTNNNVSLKPENIRKASFVEKTKVQVELSWNLVKDRMKDPQVQAHLRQTYASLENRLGFKPEYLIYAIILLFLVSIRLFGFSKTIMASSLIGIILAVSAQDLINGVPLRSTVTNF